MRIRNRGTRWENRRDRGLNGKVSSLSTELRTRRRRKPMRESHRTNVIKAVEFEEFVAQYREESRQDVDTQ